MHESQCQRLNHFCSVCSRVCPVRYAQAHIDLHQMKWLCQHCNSAMSYFDWSNHESKCQQRSQRCEWCDELVLITQYRQHQIECGGQRIACNQCQRQVERQFMAMHRQYSTLVDSSEAQQLQEMLELMATIGVPLCEWLCRQCRKMIPKHLRDRHQRTDCMHRTQQCQYCEMDVKLYELAEHEQICGARTETCPKCLRRMTLKALKAHQSCEIGQPQQPARLPTNAELDARSPDLRRRAPIVLSDDDEDDVLDFTSKSPPAPHDEWSEWAEVLRIADESSPPQRRQLQPKLSSSPNAAANIISASPMKSMVSVQSPVIKRVLAGSSPPSIRPSSTRLARPEPVLRPSPSRPSAYMPWDSAPDRSIASPNASLSTRASVTSASPPIPAPRIPALPALPTRTRLASSSSSASTSTSNRTPDRLQSIDDTLRRLSIGARRSKP